MQVTVDIPDNLYHSLEQLAAATHRSVENTLLEQAAAYVQGMDAPLVGVLRKKALPPFVPAGEPGTVDLTKNLNDAVFDDFDPS